MIQPTNAQPLYPQQGGANAVSINIYNPQAYAGQAPQQMAQPAPYAYQNPLYQMPQASMYKTGLYPSITSRLDVSLANCSAFLYV